MPPPQYSLCLSFVSGDNVVHNMSAFTLPAPQTAISNYAYNIGPYYFSAGPNIFPPAQANTMQMFLTQDANFNYGFTVLADVFGDSTGGAASMELISSNLGSPILWVQDDVNTAARVVINADDAYEWWINGVPQPVGPNYQTWQNTDVYFIKYKLVIYAIHSDSAYNGNTIAIQAQDLYGISYGLTAEITTPLGQVIGTNSTFWKCTGTYTAGWMNPGFDDSSWPFASDAGWINEGTPGSWYNGMYKSPRQWVSTSRHFTAHLPVLLFCSNYFFITDLNGYKIDLGSQCNADLYNCVLQNCARWHRNSL